MEFNKPFLLLIILVMIISCKNTKVDQSQIIPTYVDDITAQYVNIYDLFDHVPLIHDKLMEAGITKGRKSADSLDFKFDDNQVLVIQKTRYIQYCFIVKRRAGFNGLLENYNIRYDKKTGRIVEFLAYYPLYEKDKKVLINKKKSFVQFIDGIKDIHSADTTGLKNVRKSLSICKSQVDDSVTDQESQAAIKSRKVKVDDCSSNNVLIYNHPSQKKLENIELVYTRHGFYTLLKPGREFILSLPEKSKRCYFGADELILDN